MANTSSALKAARQTERRTIRNRAEKTRLKTLRKQFNAAVAAEDKDAIKTAGPALASAMDRATKTGVVHKNAAARTKSTVAHAMN